MRAAGQVPPAPRSPVIRAAFRSPPAATAPGRRITGGPLNRAGASRYTSRRQKLSLQVRHPSRRDRMDRRHARGCCSTRRTWRSTDAKSTPLSSSNADRKARLSWASSISATKSGYWRKSTNLHLGSSSPGAAQGTVMTGSVAASSTDQSASIRVSSSRVRNPAASSPPNSRRNRQPGPGRRNGLHAPSPPAAPASWPAKRRGSMATS